MMTVEELREWMQRHGLNYDKAADMLGMPRRTFARLLSGEKEIDLCIAHACANIDAGRCPLGDWPELLKSAGGESPRPTKRAATNNYVFDVACKGKKDEGQPKD